MVLGPLSYEINRPLYVVGSWHIFRQHWLQTFLLPRLGVFSIHREGSDRESLKTAMQVIAAAKRPLVIFPEGVISRHNDRLNHLMEGTALIARGAAKQRATANPPGKVVVHPVAIRYFFDGDVEAAVRPVLRDIEQRLTWQPHDDQPIKDRIAKIGHAQRPCTVSLKCFGWMAKLRWSPEERGILGMTWPTAWRPRERM